MARKDDLLVGLCVPMDADRLETLEPIGSGATSSSFSQANPRPGTSVPTDDRARLVPVVSGGQGSDLEIVTLKAGAPALSTTSSAQLGYRFAGEADSKTRGWSACSMLTGWGAPITGANNFNVKDICCIPGSQRLLLMYSTDSDSHVGIARFDPATWTWLSDDDALPDVGNDSADALLALPDGRVLLLAGGNAYRSDDEGATWVRHSVDTFAPFDHDAKSIDQGRMAYSNGQILYIGDNLSAGADDIYQLASDNLLGSLEVVYDESPASNVGYQPCVQALPAGGFIVGYIRSSDDHYCVRLLASAWQPFSDGEVIVIRASASADGVVVADPDGLLWCYVTDATNRHQLYVYVSVDGGRTWTLTDHGGVETASSAADYWYGFAACSWMGSVALAHSYVASTEGVAGEVVGVASFGGWSTVTDWGGVAFPLTDVEITLTNRTAFGPSSDYTLSYVPMELPANSGLFSSVGAGGQVVGSGQLTVTTVASQRYYTTGSIGASQVIGAMYLVRVAAGGSLTADNIVFGVRSADNTNDREITIRHDTTGFRLIDANSAATLATVTLDMTIATEIAVRIGTVVGTLSDSVWYRRLGSTEWTEAWSGTLTNDTATPNANGLIIFGHFVASSTGISQWSIVRAHSGQAFASGLSPAAATSAYTAGVLGRPLTRLPVPLEHETGDGDYVAWLSVSGGLAGLNEVYDVPADYDYPIEHIVPTLSPSPAERWRSTDKTEQVIVWDFGQSTWIGDSIALVALGCNFRLAYLEAFNGATWDTIGTLNLTAGGSSLTWTLSGDSLIPAAAGASSTRYYHEGELAGGFAVITKSAGGTSIGRKILWNTAGRWGPAATVASRPRITLEVDGTEDGSGAANASLVAPSGVLVVHSASVLQQRYWRVRIPASQVTRGDEAYYEAGVLVPMAVRAFGAPPDWGWTRERAPNVEIRRSRYGTTRARKLGPTIRTWTMGWPSGVDLRGMREQTTPDYQGSSVGLPLATAEDVPWLTGGLLELAESGSVPVVALTAIPDASGVTITDPSLWMYGRLTASVRQDHLVGKENAYEIVRVPDLVVEEIV